MFPLSCVGCIFYRCLAALHAASFVCILIDLSVCLSAGFCMILCPLVCIWSPHQSCIVVCRQSLSTKGILHALPTLQNNEPVPQVLKQVVNLSCFIKSLKFIILPLDILCLIELWVSKLSFYVNLQGEKCCVQFLDVTVLEAECLLLTKLRQQQMLN